uniref:Putative capsid protein n=1 Tax=viral metagenome TaxID=1070528 RepID=A0A6M3LS95_9ZZZZ
MATGWTTTGSLAESLDDVRSSARIVREYEGVIPQLCDKQTLGEGIGLSWQEITYAQLTAQAVTENTDLDNPQQIADSLLTITPQVVGLETFITDRVRARISKKGYAKMGSLGQNAIQRKKDEDGLTIFASGATTASPGAGATLTSGHIASAKVNISSNATEPGNPPYYFVGHGFQIKDLFDELVAGVGTYVVDEGPTARVFQEGFRLPIAGCTVYENGNITIDSSADAIGGVFAKEGIVLVQGRSPRIVDVRNEKRGGGGYHVYHYDEYAYGERPSAAYGWVQKIVSDATAPTS